MTQEGPDLLVTCTYAERSVFEEIAAVASDHASVLGRIYYICTYDGHLIAITLT